MSIRDEFKPYLDGNGLMAPNLNPGLVGSDNGPMFTSEYYTILKKHGELTPEDVFCYTYEIRQCIHSGILNRVPYPQTASQIGPDDYYGVLNGCAQLGITSIPRSLLWGMIKNLGFLNNVDDRKTARSFLIRQPQLIAAMLSASYPDFGPIECLIRLLAFPVYIVAAISIAISCRDTPIEEADPRRLSWHLLQNTSRVSLLCWLASLIWYRRLYKDYGVLGMQMVAAYYYQPKGLSNPYAKYWVTK